MKLSEKKKKTRFEKFLMTQLDIAIHVLQIGASNENIQCAKALMKIAKNANRFYGIKKDEA